jgi:Icc-related predicted phosphoesterase
MGLKITCISDTHNQHKKIIVPKSDIIIHAGDFTSRGYSGEVEDFLKWYSKQDAEYKVLVLGNHEVELSKKPFQEIQQLVEDHGIILLHNSHVTIAGLKIYGSPFSNEFGRGWAYNANERLLAQMYEHIEPDIDILVTHGPAKGKLDLCPGGHVGSQSLAYWIDSVPWKLKLHVTGHIHESRGVGWDKTDTYSYITVNAAMCGIPYSDLLVNPITVEI